MSLEALVQELVSEVAQLLMRVTELERRGDNSLRHGKVTDVDTKKQLARIEIGEQDGKPVKSAWVPYGQVAGTDDNLKIHSPPVVGQQMTLFAPNGEMRQAMLKPFTWYDKAQSPSQAPDEHVLTLGTVKIVLKKNSLSVKVGNTEVELTESKLNLFADKISAGKDTYLGQESKGETDGQALDLSDGIAAKRVFGKPA